MRMDCSFTKFSSAMFASPAERIDAALATSSGSTFEDRCRHTLRLEQLFIDIDSDVRVAETATLLERLKQPTADSSALMQAMEPATKQDADALVDYLIHWEDPRMLDRAFKSKSTEQAGRVLLYKYLKQVLLAA